MGQKTDADGCEPNKYSVSSFPGERRLWELGGISGGCNFGSEKIPEMYLEPLQREEFLM